MNKILLKDIVIPAGTIFMEAPIKTERFGCDHYEAIIGLSDNTSGSLVYCIDDDPHIMHEYFKDEVSQSETICNLLKEAEKK